MPRRQHLLSRILRHGAQNVGLHIDEAGWVRVNSLVEKFPCLRDKDLGKLVDDDNKGRFSLRIDDGVQYIRANQGHSIGVVSAEKLLSRIESPTDIPNAIHGTTPEALHFILEGGLCRMTRNNIHFAMMRSTKAGIRKTSTVFIYIDIKRAMEAGIPFYISDNGVVLSPGMGDTGCISPEYFKKIETLDD